MTWQEELRQLDSALAGGELSANDYRKRRDEILAAASSAQPPSPVIGPPSGANPVPDDDATDADVTQVVTTDAHETELADDTQIISDPARHETETTQVVNNSAEKTQVITADERTAPAIQQPPWAANMPDPNAQTGAFPRPPQQQQMLPAVTPGDAQALFTTNKPPNGNGKGKPWLVVIAIVVVLALAGGAVWYFGFRDKNPSTPASDGPSATTQPKQPEVNIAEIELPGEKVKNGGRMDIAKARDLKVIAAAEAQQLEAVGVGPMVYAGSSDGGYRFLLYSFESDDAEAAAQLTGEVAKVQEELGLKEAQVEGVPKAVGVSEVSNAKAAAMRGLYTYGNTTLLLCVLQVPTGDKAELTERFTTALTSVTDAAPPAG